VSTAGLHHVAVEARDLEASVRFYQALGLSERLRFSEPGEGGVTHTVVFLGTSAQTFVELFSPTPEGPAPVGAGVPNGESLFHFALRVDDVDNAFQAALGAGGTQAEPPTDTTLRGSQSVPCRYAFVRGPSGETIELIAVENL
jgi:catechol 2,3-dioxygenase-like lactoylglutathione lyase family enzyme